MSKLLKKIERVVFNRGNNEAPFKFHGGLELAPNKLGLDKSIQTIPLPNELVIPLLNYHKQLLEPVVSIGDHVQKGQWLAHNLPCPANGTVRCLEEREVMQAQPLLTQCIVIDVIVSSKTAIPSGTSPTNNCNTISGYNDNDNSTNNLWLETLQQHGLTGLGGAAFPTAAKLQTWVNANNANTKKAVNTSQLATLIINAAECEPSIACDEALMQAHADEIVKGIELLKNRVQCERCVIAIEDSKPRAIAKIKLALEKQLTTTKTDTPIELLTIPTRYPSGAESVLIKIVTGQSIPKSKLPIDFGVVCLNVGTAYAVWQSYQGEPLTSRIISLTGPAMPNPCNVRVSFGTSIEHVLKSTGNESALKNYTIRAGGPLTGFPVRNMQLPVSSKTNCISAHTSNASATVAQPCIRCNACVDVCPEYLLPQQLHWHISAANWQQSRAQNLFDCIECGCCDVVCPSNIELSNYFRYAKAQLLELDWQEEQAKIAQIRYENRNKRLERLKAEREKEIAFRKSKLATKPAQGENNIADAIARAKARQRNKKKS